MPRNIQRRRETNTKANKRWRQRNPEKAHAHMMVNNALRSGKLLRQPCITCGALEADAHHEDYSRPYEITWLCNHCHTKKHNLEKWEGHIKAVPPSRRPRIRVTHKTLRYEDAYVLREAGHTYQIIADCLGVTKATVWKWLNNPDYK